MNHDTPKVTLPFMARLNLDMLKNPSVSEEVETVLYTPSETVSVSIDPEKSTVSEITPEVPQEIIQETTSRLDLLESEEVKFWVDFYDNSLANELANEKDVAELLVQGAASESSPVATPVTPEPVAASSNKLNLLSLASDISSAEAKTESSLTSEKAHTSVEESTLKSSEVVSLSVESETLAFSPKIGKKDELSHTTHPVKEAEISLESPKSEVIEDFFPNLVVGFEEDEKAEYAREVAKNLSESRKGGLISLFGGRAMIHTTIAIAAIAGVTAFSVFVIPGILHSIKGNSVESHKGVISVDVPTNPPVLGENKAPATENKVPVGDIVPPNPQNQTAVPPPVKPPEQNGGSPINTGTMSTTQVNPPVTQIAPVTYKEWVDFQVVQGNKKNKSQKK